MELFAVIDKATSKQIGKGFDDKLAAKQKRNELQGATKRGMPPKDQTHDQTLWDFKVTPGKDHRNYQRA